MSISSRHLHDPVIRLRVLRLYVREAETLEWISRSLGLTLATALAIVKREIPEGQRREIKKRNYARSKMAEKNPRLGKKPTNYIGLCDDGYGYHTEVENGKRYFKHRMVMAEQIGISVADLPSSLVVHHINGEKTDNRPDNLCLVTNAGHMRLHAEMNRMARLSQRESSQSIRDAVSVPRDTEENGIDCGRRYPTLPRIVRPK